MIGKKVLRIAGNVPAANFLQLPKVKGQTLGLTGRFLYLEVRVNPGKFFMVHLDVTAADRNTTRVSISNIFKEGKNVVKGGTALHIPLVDPSPKWYIMCIDLAAALAEVTASPFEMLRGMQLCATMLVRNAFTSDIKYSATTLPREMMLVHTKDAQQYFDMVWLPSEPVDAEEAVERRPALQATQPHVPGLGLARGLKVVRPPSAFGAAGDEAGKTSFHLPSGGAGDGEAAGKDAAWLELERVNGFSGENIGVMKWGPAGKEMVFASGAAVVAMDAAGERQRFFLGHTAHVVAMAFSSDGSILATAQEGHTALVRLWDFASGTCVGVLGEHHSGLTCLDISPDGSSLAAIGLDAKGRQVIALWDISQVFKGQKSSLTVKHVTNYNVVAIKFSPFESGKLLTCGRDSIRFYRLKDGQLRGCSIQFGDLKAVQDSKSVPRGDIGKNVFTDIAFEAGYGLADHDERHVFVSSVGGAVFQINYGQRRLECVYQLHNGAINNLIVSEGFCITGSDDKFLRVWPVDFSDFFLEVEHDSPVTGVGISPNQLQVCIGTEKGSVGTMDIPSHKYVTLLRSHTDDIRQVAADPMHAEYTTVSLDGSIRVWSDATHEQLFEFDAKGQVPTCVMYHPKEYVFACGFESGIVRVYNIERTSLLQEHCQHKGAVTEVLFTPNGALLLTAGSEGNICVYDVAQNYMPVKYLAASLPKKPIAMSISKDGKYLATSGAEPNSVLLFDAETLAPISKVESPSGGLSKVMLSPNSNQLFVTTTDRKLECFEVPSGRFQYQMGSIHRTDCEAFDIHSSGQYVVTGGHDNLLKVWDCSPESVSSKRPGCQKFIAHSEGVSSVVLNRSSTKVISVGCSDTIYIWKWVGKPEGAEEPLSLEEAIVESALGMGDDDFAPGPPMPLPGVHWTETSPDEGLEANQVDPQCQTSIGFNGSAHSNVVWNAERGVFAYSNENSVVVEDLKTKKQEFLTLHTQSISTLALNKSGTLLASGSGAPEVERGMAPVYVWDLATNSCVQQLFYHKTGVQALTISDDDMWVVSVGCAPESFVVVWHLHTGDMAAVATTKTPSHALAWRPLAATPEFITVGENYALHWLLSEGRLVSKMLPLPAGPTRRHFTAVCFESNSRIFIGDNFGCVWLIEAQGDVTCGKCTGGIAGEVTSLFASGGRLMVGSSGCELTLLEADASGSGGDYSVSQRLTVDGPVNSLVMDPSGSEGIVGTGSSTVWYCNVERSEVVQLVSGHQGQVLSISAASGTPYYATSCFDGSLHVWSISGRTASKLMRFDAEGHCLCSALTPSGDACVGGYSDGIVRRFQMDTAQTSRVAREHDSPVCSCYFSLDGSRLLTAAVSGTVAIFDAENLAAVGFPRDVAGVSASPGRRLDGLAVCSDRSIACAAWIDGLTVFEVDWDGGSPRPLAAFTPPGTEDSEATAGHALAAFAPDKHSTVLYLSPLKGSHLYFFNYATNQATRFVELAAPATSLGVSPPGGPCRVVVGTEDGAIVVLPFKAKVGEPRRLLGHAGRPVAVAFSSCGHYVVSGGGRSLMYWKL